MKKFTIKSAVSGSAIRTIGETDLHSAQTDVLCLTIGEDIVLEGGLKLTDGNTITDDVIILRVD
jgi:hypothetical protein